MFEHMPADQKRRTGEIFLLSPRTKALGEQLMKDVEASGKLGKEGANKIDEQIIARVMDLGELNDIKASMRPEFLSLEGNLKAFGLKWADYLSGGKVIQPQAGDTPERAAEKSTTREWFRHYNEFGTGVQERFNNRIKALSGTAVSGSEEKRMYLANPNPTDSPSVFEDKVNKSIDMQQRAIARYNWLKTQYSPEKIADLARTGKISDLASLDSITGIYNRRGQEIDKQLQSQGVPADQVPPLRKQQLKKEFGI
jgi:hypothetical protein